MSMAMTVDQATHLRSLVQGSSAPADAGAGAAMPPRRQRATVVAITSGKGGVGKSNVAVNLAITLAGAGKRVTLLDADLGLANADVLCNVDLRTNLSHVIARKKELSDVLVKAPGGFNLIGGASGLARMADLTDDDRQRLVDALGELEQQADVILIDTGAGISPNVLSFTRAADHVLVVTTPEPTAITDAYAVIKVISRDGTDRRLSLLVNQARSPAEARVVYERIATLRGRSSASACWMRATCPPTSRSRWPCGSARPSRWPPRAAPPASRSRNSRCASSRASSARSKAPASSTACSGG